MQRRSSDSGVRERWRGPGRLRLDIDALVLNPVLARSLEAVVGDFDHVTGAKASTSSGSLLISYDEARAPGGYPEQLRVGVETQIREHGVFPELRAGSENRTALRQVLDVTRQRPGERIGPALVTVGAHSLTTLQGLSLAAIGTLGAGGSPRIFRWLGLADARSNVHLLTGATFLLTGVGLWATYKRRQAWRRLSQVTEHRLRTEVFVRLESQDLAFFESHGTGQLMAMLLDDSAQIGALMEEADSIIESGLTMLFAGTALMRSSTRLAAIAVASVPFLLFPVRILRPKSRRLFAETSAARAGMAQAFDNILAGIVEVKSFTAEGFEARRIRQLSADLAEVAVDAHSSSQLQTAIGGNIFYGGYTLAMAHGAQRVLAGRMPEGQLAGAAFWYPRLLGSLGRVSESTNAYYGARASAERLRVVLDAAPRVVSGPIPLAPTAVRGDIRIEGVTFGYDPSRPVLRSLSLDVPAGSTLAIIGPTGSGKSTLLRLLLRFFDPDEGRILLDGHDLRHLVIADLRSAVALVSQEVYLFNGTVRHNVLYGRPSASDYQVIGALNAAGAGDLLASLPQGLDQQVGERGQRLSGGQRQRVAIARALLKSAPILALDEPTSQLDYATEAAVKESLNNATRGKTVIYVAHRLATIRDADKIAVMDQGELREEGTHESLLDRRGLYYNLWQLQS